MIARLALAAVAAGLIAVSGPAPAQQPIVIKFSHVVAPNTPKGKGAEYFKKIAEERTKGKVKVEVYANSTLYKDNEEVDALQLGAVQMLAPSLAKFGPLGVREFEVFDLPYLFDNYDELHKVTRGPVGASLLKKLEAKGIVGLAYWDNGFMDMSANKPLRMPEDFRGLKMRIQSSKVLDAEMRALGASPQVMAFSEVYQALQTGVVDGTENPPELLQEDGECRGTSRLEPPHLAYGVIVNKKFWDGLPPDIRKILDEAMVDATQYADDIAKKENDDALEAVRKTGKTQFITLTPEEKLAWKRALIKVHKEVEPRIGKELIESIYKETGFDPTSCSRKTSARAWTPRRAHAGRCVLQVLALLHKLTDRTESRGSIS